MSLDSFQSNDQFVEEFKMDPELISERSITNKIIVEKDNKVQ